MRPHSGCVVSYKRRKRRRFATGVVQLYADDRPVGMGKLHYTFKWRNLTV